MLRNVVKSIGLVTVVVAVSTSSAWASIKSTAQAQLPALQALAANSTVTQAVSTANGKDSAWTKSQITEYGRDWRKQIAANQGGLLDAVKSNPATALLNQALQSSNGVYQEVTLYDAQGIIVADTQIDKAYHNGSKALWSHAFTVNGSYVSGVRSDHKTSIKTVLVAVPVLDATQKPIGVLAATLDAKTLEGKEVQKKS